MSAQPHDSLSLSNLTVRYETKDLGVTALDNVSLEIPASGYTLGVVGESGSGKTTLGLSMMNSIERPGKIVGGQILYRGKDILRMGDRELNKYRWREISMIYQSAMNSLNPVKTVSDPIIEVLRKHQRLGKSEATERALKLISEVGLDSARAGDYPHELSGGMRQRIVIALALALSPKILVADEPSSALDVVTQRQILNLLKEKITEKKLSIVFITHEISLLSGLVDNVAVMFAGEIVESGTINEVLFDPLHPYTEMLVETLLTIESTEESLPRISKSYASERPPLSACPYANRCKYAFERCRAEKPVLRDIKRGRAVACHKYG